MALIIMPARFTKVPPIRVHRERVDDTTDAVIAYCFTVRRRVVRQNGERSVQAFLYGLSQYTLAAHDRFAEAAGEQRLRDTIKAQGFLPLVGKCADLVGWSDFE